MLNNIYLINLQPGRPYSFAYGINDQYSGVNLGQEEKSDGNVVEGSYTVQLPDGRKQIVSTVYKIELNPSCYINYVLCIMG